jgi:hypothetical protein
MDYTQKHLDALEKVTEKGAPVSFDAEGTGAYDELTDTEVEVPGSSVAGFAVEIPGNADEYEALELIGHEAVTLFFVPTVMGQKPAKNSKVNWAGALRTVKENFPIRPAGVYFAGRIIVV